MIDTFLIKGIRFSYTSDIDTSNNR